MKKKNKFKILFPLLFLIPLLTGCMSGIQKQQYLMWEQDGQLVNEKSPALAAGLGLLPGGGAFYTGETGVGIIGLIFWPVSILWEPFVSLDTAQMRNYNATYRQQKNKMLRALKALNEERKRINMDSETYKFKKREIHEKFFIAELIDW